MRVTEGIAGMRAAISRAFGVPQGQVEELQVEVGSGDGRSVVDLEEDSFGALDDAVNIVHFKVRNE